MLVPSEILSSSGNTTVAMRIVYLLLCMSCTLFLNHVIDCLGYPDDLHLNTTESPAVPFGGIASSSIEGLTVV